MANHPQTASGPLTGSVTGAASPFVAGSPAIPPLENGDRLKRAEFHRRYEAMPGIKAELIEGIVYLASPVRFVNHGRPSYLISNWLGAYEKKTPGVQGAENSTLCLDEDNEPQPDLLLRVRRSAGGQTDLNSEGYLVGGPELVFEVTASTESNDLHDKLEVYRRNRVKEYVVWRTRDNAVDWFVCRDGKYARLAPAADGYLKSEAFPGLWLDTAALFRDDLPTMEAAVDLGVASPEHAAFVAKLKQA